MPDVWAYYETLPRPPEIVRIVDWERLARLLYKQLRDHGCGLGSTGEPCDECRNMMLDYEEAASDRA